MQNGDTAKPSWLEKPIAAICILLMVISVSVVVIGNSSSTQQRSAKKPGYAVTIRHYGVDVREMERTVAIPLEDALSSLPGVTNVLTSSENGQVRAFVRFESDIDGRYESLREAAQHVYEMLPRSAQRPEIVSSDNSRIPVWMAAVINRAEDSRLASLGGTLEWTIKPVLEALEGAGEVEISGTGLPEIMVSLKPEVSAARGVSAADVAGALGVTDLLLPGGILESDNTSTLISVDGRFRDIQEMANALIPLKSGGLVQLKDIAEVYEQDRKPDILSRLDGKPTAMIAVMGTSDANLGALSRAIKTELDGFLDLSLDFFVLSDRGAEEEKAYKSILSAALQGAVAVAVIVAILSSRKKIFLAAPGKFNRKRIITLICALAVPLILILAAALLSLLGFPMDRAIIAGLAAGVGSAVDATILCSERLGSSKTILEGQKSLRALRPSLLSGSFTTIVALVPLLGIENLAGGIDSIAWGIGMITLISVCAALFLLPPLFLWGLKDNGPSVKQRQHNSDSKLKKYLVRIFLFGHSVYSRIARFSSRLLARNISFTVKRPVIVMVFWLIISAVGIFLLIMADIDIGAETSTDSLYAQVEFEGGFRAENIDMLLGSYAESIRQYDGIKGVQTSAKLASGTVLISFDPQKLSVDIVRDLARSTSIPEGFLYIPEASASERIWEITISGDDDAVCRELAGELARQCSTNSIVREVVLNFKEGSKRLRLHPDREQLVETQIPFSTLADTLRRGIHGPVAYKRIDILGETDVRIRGISSQTPSKRDVDEMLVVSNTTGIYLPLKTLVYQAEDREPSSIRRQDRRRVASISIRTKPMDPRAIKAELSNNFNRLELPRGYTIEFDREAIKTADSLGGSIFLFVLAVAFCFMVIAGTNESFGIPIAVLSVVPPSLAVPVLVTVLIEGSINSATACAFIAVSGMAVNASILTADELKRSLRTSLSYNETVVYRALRTRLPVLLSTTLTTMAGALPFLFLADSGNAIIRSLAFVTTLGVGTSCIGSVTMLPAMARMWPPLFKSFKFSSVNME
jgi:multidrug efflux pump subunit AcrB